MKHPGSGAGGGAGHTAKHTRSKKHVHGKGKHHPQHQPAGHHAHQGTKVHTVAKHPHHPRGLALGDLLPVCTFEALAMSLRLAGQRVSDDDLLGLWDLAGGREVSIAEALDAAVRFGLAGCHPGVPWSDLNGRGDSATPPRTGALDDNLRENPLWPLRVREHAGNGGFMILGVDVPGPHAVLATPDGWWSWGSLWSPWTRAISEAWAVSWPS